MKSFFVFINLFAS